MRSGEWVLPSSGGGGAVRWGSLLVEQRDVGASNDDSADPGLSVLKKPGALDKLLRWFGANWLTRAICDWRRRADGFRPLAKSKEAKEVMQFGVSAARAAIVELVDRARKAYLALDLYT